jgi:hypothetical protein
MTDCYKRFVTYIILMRVPFFNLQPNKFLFCVDNPAMTVLNQNSGLQCSLQVTLIVMTTTTCKWHVEKSTLL